MAEVGAYSPDELSSDMPSWAVFFTALGWEMASQPTRSVGSKYPVAVVSVPTGQYAAWLLAAGALGAPPKLESDFEPGSYLCTTWDDGRKQVADAEVSVSLPDSHSEADLIFRVGTTTYLKGIPALRHRVSPPAERFGQLTLPKVDRERIADAIRPLMPRDLPWFMWWTKQCLSPVFIVGSGSDYLMNQRHELLAERPHWIWPTVHTLLGLDMPRITDSMRALQFPFTITSEQAAGRSPWLRSLKPRLVVYTSWGAFSRRHPAAFTGVPTIVLSNRRVRSSLDCADVTQSLMMRAPELRSAQFLKRGIDLRLVEYSVEVDDGSATGEDESIDDF